MSLAAYGPAAAAAAPRLLPPRRILVVTDDVMNRALLEALLRVESDFEPLVAGNPAEIARAMAGVALVVVDLSMSGAEVEALCRDLRHGGAARVPLLLLSPHSGPSSVDRSRAMAAGADDVLCKPFHRGELLLRIRALLGVKQLRDELDEAEQILLALCRAVESKATYTHAHSERVAVYAEMLGRAVGLTRDDLRVLRRAALLHDVGKLAIPDLLLTKPGALTSDETRVLRRQMLLPMEAAAAAAFDATPQIVPMIRHLQERYDGAGYPDHLQGRHIPLGSRLLAVVDAFDTMTTHRPYRSALTPVRAAAQLRADRGAQWDEELVDAFLRALDAREVAAPAR